jgi:hypothetical protein
MTRDIAISIPNSGMPDLTTGCAVSVLDQTPGKSDAESVDSGSNDGLLEAICLTAARRLEEMA